MKYIFLFIASLLFIKLHGQTFSFNSLLTRDEIITDNSGKITITGISRADQKDFLIKDESGNTNTKFKIAGTNLVLNFSDTFTRNPSAIFRLVFPDNPNGLIIKSKITSITPLKTKVESVPKTKYTGIAFWDAGFIYNAAINPECNDQTKKEILEIIRAYKNNNALGWEAAIENPFFKLVSGLKCGDTVIFKTAPPEGFATVESAGGSILSGVFGSLGGIDVTNYVQAFADFLKERIRTELTLAYMEKLKNVLVKTPELKYLLPKTYHVFTTGDIYNIPSMGVVYKSAFAEDLNNLVENFEDMVYTLPKYESLKKTESFITFIFAYHYADMSAKGYHPSDILFQLDTRYGYAKQSASNTAYTLSVLNMFSMNLRDTAANQGWINKKDLKLINKDFMYIFFGLLYEKNQELFEKSIDGKTLKDIILEGANITDQVYDLLIVANNIDTRIREFKAMSATEKKESALALFLNNADEIAALFDFSFNASQHTIKQQPVYFTLKKIIGNSVEVVKGIQENNTGKVSINALALIAGILPGGDTSKLVIELTGFTKFISDMVMAKEAKDIKLVLDRYASPVSSYRSARINKFSTTINAYPGLYFGFERNGTSHTTNKTFGITAPIGVAFNWGNKDASSVSLFLSLVDIGAALSFRWNNDTADLPKKIVLAQIFSPGTYFIYGFKNSPLALKGGMQYAPQLRSIKNGLNETIEASVVRYTIGLSVDIPVFILSRNPHLY